MKTVTSPTFPRISVSEFRCSGDNTFLRQVTASWPQALRSANLLQKNMPVVKVIELLAESNVSWEEATRQALAKVNKTIHKVKSIHIKEQSAKVENGIITSFRINAKVSFLLDD